MTSTKIILNTVVLKHVRESLRLLLYTSSCVEIYFSSGEFGSSQDSSLEMMTSLLLITGPNECDYHLSERSYTMIIMGLGQVAAVYNEAMFVPVK